MRPGRLIVRLAVAVVIVIAALAAVAHIGDSLAGAHPAAISAVTPDLLKRGAYLALQGDCAACHSVAGQPAYSGGLKMTLPIGSVYSSNITPDKTYGIGNYTLADFDRAIRFGVAGGHTLYPAMPFTSYANTRPEDVAALYAFFMQGVAPQAVANQAVDIKFPLSVRWPLTYWRWAFAPTPRPYEAPPGASPEVARGGYFVEGLGHCGECHTPRNWALGVAAQTPSAGSAFLSGAVVDAWFAPSLRNGGPDTIGSWSEADIAAFLSSGVKPGSIAFGSMGDVVAHSTQFLTPEDLTATARFLKTLADANTANAAPFAYDETIARALKSGDAGASGAMIYLDNCAACHRPDGRGYEAVFPRLAGNAAVLASDPSSLIAIVLGGSKTPRTQAAPAQFTMPSFAWRLSDSEAAAVVSFVRSSWGNKAGAVDGENVARLRKILAAEN